MACEQCHVRPGSITDAIVGGISVRFNFDKVEKASAINRAITIGLFFLTVGGLLAIIYRIVVTLYRRLQLAEDKIRAWRSPTS